MREFAQNLNACRDRLIKPALAIPKFQRKVETVSIEDTLEQVLRIIKDRDYSQFPVYEASHFRGLLTENGITRWLADHVTTQLSLVELQEVAVERVIRSEEKRGNYQFVARNMRVDDLVWHFALYNLLEAVLITANGKDTEALLDLWPHGRVSGKSLYTSPSVPKEGIAANLPVAVFTGPQN